MTDVFHPVTDRDQSLQLFETLRGQWAQGASVFRDRHVGFRGGGHVCTLYWRPEERVWGLFETPASLNRFWICWGTEHPDGAFNITVETNPPLEGYDRRCSGAFLRDNLSNLQLGHSGRVGGGRKGIGKKAFREYTDLENWALVKWPDGKETGLHLLGQIGGGGLIPGIAAFVHEVARFKVWATGR